MYTYDQTALVVIDMQYDFVSQYGSLYVSGAEKIVPRVNREILKAVYKGMEVAYTKDWHPSVTPHFREYGGKWPSHCIARTGGANFHPDLIVAGPTFYKGHGKEDGYSGFRSYNEEERQVTETGLETYLYEKHVDEIVVCGVATEYCVKETVLDALSHCFGVNVLLDAVRAVDQQTGAEALVEMEQKGARMRG